MENFSIKTLSVDEMEKVEGGMSCWLATVLAIGTAAVGGASCTTGVGCVGGVIATAYAYDTWLTACGYQQS